MQLFLQTFIVLDLQQPMRTATDPRFAKFCDKLADADGYDGIFSLRVPKSVRMMSDEDAALNAYMNKSLPTGTRFDPANPTSLTETRLYGSAIIAYTNHTNTVTVVNITPGWSFFGQRDTLFRFKFRLSIRDVMDFDRWQFPLRVCWAGTVHRFQGDTVERRLLCVTERSFAHGQLNVAISRAREANQVTARHGRRSSPADGLRSVDLLANDWDDWEERRKHSCNDTAVVPVRTHVRNTSLVNSQYSSNDQS